MSAIRYCPECNSSTCNGRKATCLGCGSVRCFAEGLGNGCCKACGYGILPGWSGSDKPCAYKGCTRRAAYARVPGTVKHVCRECAVRPKITVYAQHPLKSSKVSLRDYVINRVRHAPIAAFGQESTVAEHRARASWERAMASALRYRDQDALVEAHERTAAAYNQRAADLESATPLSGVNPWHAP